jgi:hypothetical protein
VNADGSFAYSAVVLLKKDNSIVMGMVKPNPFVSEVELLVSLSKKEMVRVVLYDEKGKQVATKQVAGVEGNNFVRFANLQPLSSGIYLLQVVAGTAVLQQKLVKLQ